MKGADHATSHPPPDLLARPHAFGTPATYPAARPAPAPAGTGAVRGPDLLDLHPDAEFSDPLAPHHDRRGIDEILRPAADEGGFFRRPEARAGRPIGDISISEVGRGPRRAGRWTPASAPRTSAR